MSADSLAAIREVDSARQLDDVLALPDHLGDALWRVESARIDPFESSGLVVCGMGGSAIGGELAKAAVGDRLTRPLLTVRAYEPPSWIAPDRAFLCSSYSGNTEETSPVTRPPRRSAPGASWRPRAASSPRRLDATACR